MNNFKTNFANWEIVKAFKWHWADKNLKPGSFHAGGRKTAHNARKVNLL